MDDHASGQRDRRTGLLIVASAFVAALCVSWWARTVSGPSSSVPLPPTTEGLVGFPKHVDVILALAAAEELTDRRELRGIAAWGVRSTGTIDLSEPASRVRYVFGSARGEGPQPPRSPGTLPRRAYCGKQTVQLGSRGLAADPDLPAQPCATRTEPLPAPRCGPKEIWKEAIRRGAPADRRATVEYYRAAGGPAWRFELPGTTHSFVLYGDCVRELSGADTVGSVP